MNKENDILKWFNGELSTKKIKELYPNEDFSVLEKAGFYSKQLEVPKVDVDAALADFKLNNTKKDEAKILPLNFNNFLKIAAIFVVLLASSYFVFFNNEKSFSTEIAESINFDLPDGSHVVLNSKSDISFNKADWKSDRSLNLDGEAFFKVTKGQKFTVITNAGSVQVLGTQFNVKERDDYFEVRCYEGSVSVKTLNSETTLLPGNLVRLVKGEQIVLEKFNASTPSWLSNETSFKDVPLWQVIAELEIQYDIKITTTDNVDKSKLFTGTFTHKNKDLALQAVTIPLNLSYKIEGKNVEFYNYDAN